ncbi:MAG: SDR family oxidoreductase [Trebonia sp.]
MGKQILFLTGATGVVGRALLEELARDYSVVCLNHRAAVDDQRVRTVSGDLTEPDFGLPRADFRQLARGTDVVLHCAASTRWNISRDVLFRVNVDGTRQVVDFAAQADAVLYHVSTAFVASHDYVAGDDFVAGGGEDGQRGSGPMAYVASKAAAEEVVSGSGLPAVTLRPSVFIGASRDGRIAAFQGIHKVAGLMLKDSLPVLPADPANLIDFIPQDVAAKAVRRLLERQVSEGTYWLTAGEHAATVADLVQVTLDLAAALGVPAHSPRLMPASAVGRLLLPLLDDVMSPSLRRQFRLQLDLLHLFQSSGPLPSSLRDLGIQVTRDSQLDAFRRSAEYWAFMKGLGGAPRDHRAADQRLVAS